ncbi:concanavalin A-lectin/glucanase domain protein [Thermococcus prieurii virus 1]|uniref:concanavalin A-lectin/glucanase domain protein n=1 Tax=Thermococcus prieurii virus 1 TaxID=1115696 RepID=UPI00024FB21D|nr:concanavalin A-lectin/glucanase domain protein [Thermococcus prieurii virus 1]AEY69071.1 putative concanavalin A-like lectin/glucanase [Thermococcus prieurii virus 1]AFA44835.1 concanavalin A-lectin/glucanase domain protein [Thermococcus prieurii virus 1]
MRRASFLLLFIVLGSLAVVTAPVRAAGEQYYGVQFNKSSYVLVKSSSSLDSITSNGAFTAIVFAVSYNDSTNGNVFARAGNLGWRARFNANHKPWFLVGNGSGAFKILIGHTTLHQGETYMLAFSVKVGGYMKIYVNGKLDASMEYTLNRIGGNGTPLYLGAVVPTAEHLIGKEYEVLIYNRALSDEEIKQIYENPLDPPRDGLVLEYLPSSVDMVNNVWKDLSGNGNDGSIVGASYVPLRPISEAQFTEDWGLNFTNGRMNVGNLNDFMFTKAVSVIAVIRYDPSEQTQVHAWIVGKGRDVESGFHLDVLSKTRLEMRVGVNQSGTTSVITFGTSFTNYYNDTVMVAGVYDVGTGGALYINGQKVAGTTVAADEIIYSPNTVLGIGHESFGSNLLYPFPGDIYLVIIYARALNSSEIQQIYEHPLDPPKDGLVLFYSPYSYDPESGRWLNVAPIFPTVPLAEELDATNYGAEPVRVSIPQLAVYDIENNSEIPISNVSVAMLEQNQTISLIPSLLTLPYNSTITLNVSATGYLPRTLRLSTPVSALTIYLQPQNKSEALNVEQGINATEVVKNITSYVSITPINSYAKAFMDSGGSFGDTIKLALKGDSLMRLILPQVLILAIVIVVLVQTTSPLAALGGALIGWAMSLGILGEAPSLRNSGMTFMLVVFLVAWTLWDLFYNYSRET